MTSITPAQYIENLKWRYATKVFDPSQKIPAESWHSIEESLILTPSSFGLQPWHFVVVSSGEVREKLLPHSWNQKQVVDCSHFVVLAARENLAQEEIDDFLQRTAEVREVDISSLEPYGQMMSGFISQMNAEQTFQWAKLQTYIALGQLMTTAASLGIDACPMEGINPAEYDQLLDLPSKGYRTSVACALGYRSSGDKYAELAKVRYQKDQLLTRI